MSKKILIIKNNIPLLFPLQKTKTSYLTDRKPCGRWDSYIEDRKEAVKKRF